jgi:hypothetical protein
MASPGGNQSAATTLSRLWTYCDALRTAGFRVQVASCLPRSDAAAPGDFNTKRATLNASIVSEWASHANALCDIAADARVGDDGDSDVTTYYDADKVHLNVAGHRDVMSVLSMTTATAAFGFAEVAPDDISGLIGWWEADGLSLSDGDPVSSWTDLSGQGHHATNTGSNRPTYETGIQNSLPVVRFAAASSQYLLTDAINLSGTDDITLIVVGGGITAGANQLVFEMSTNYNNVTDSFSLLHSSGNNPDFGLKGNVGYSSYSPSGGWSSTWIVAAGVMNMGAATRELVAWRNGVMTGTRSNNSNNTGSFGNRACYIGGRGGASLFLTGDIACILLYNRALTGGERGRLEELLAAKYALY